jgi:hypothetical protein
MANISNSNTLNKFDVIGFAKKIIGEIDSVRSYSNDTDSETQSGFKRPEESRVNAFMRLIGFPMFVVIEKDGDKSSGELAGNRILNPGWCGGKFSGYKIKNMDNISSLGLSLASELSLRETLLLTTENNIGSDQMNKDMKDALDNPISLVPSMTKPAQVKSQVYSRRVYKKLFPLISSYRVVMPKMNETARPFVTAENRMLDFNTELKQPFLETIIRIRIISMENAGSTKENTKKDDFLNSIKSNVTPDEFADIKKKYSQILTSADVIDIFILNKLFTSLTQLANKWVQLKRSQEYLKKLNVYKISIKTTSSKISPFGKRMDVTADAELMEQSETGIRLKELKSKLSQEEALLSLLPTTDVSDSSNSKIASTKNTTSGTLVGPFADLINTDASQLRKEIKSLEEGIKQNVQQMEALRLELDMMTGEFSGISIPDVVSVIIALFMIDKQYLMALLDDDVKDNMRKDDTLAPAVDKYDIGGDSIEAAAKAVGELQKAVEFVFDVLNKIIDSNYDRTKRNKEVIKDPNIQIDGDVSFGPESEKQVNG